MLVHSLVAAVAFLVLHAALAPFFRPRNTSARVHYVLCLVSVAVYACADWQELTRFVEHHGG